MLNMKNINDREKMLNYYRTHDMLNLLYFFPKLSPITELIIVENEQEYLNNQTYLENFSQNRADTLKGRTPISGIENSGGNDTFYDALTKIKEKDSQGVLVLFNLDSNKTERYERLAGISVGVNIGDCVIIDAVSKGFDGREVSKSICTHERYYIPWFDLRRLCISNFNDYKTYQISDKEYQITRTERTTFLKSIGLNPLVFEKQIPEQYQNIPEVVWLSVIKNLLKQLEKNEDILTNYKFTNFAISGHTEGTEFKPWQMYDKSRYTLVKRKNI